jgi:cell wall-associated NlpC family hydrolase
VFANQSKLEESVNEVIGTEYAWGGTSTEGFDCSGFILYTFLRFDVKLPRTTVTQSQAGAIVKKNEMREGDLVFFNTSGKGISHAGIYLGGGRFAHSSSSKGVTISNLSDKYYRKRYVTARRVVSEEIYSNMTDSIN